MTSSSSVNDPGTTTVEADFLADLRRMVIAQLTAGGFTADASLATEALLWSLLRVRYRRIERRKRRTAWSSQLRARHDALPADIVSGLGSIVLASENGDDMNPFLS